MDNLPVCFLEPFPKTHQKNCKFGKHVDTRHKTSDNNNMDQEISEAKDQIKTLKEEVDISSGSGSGSRTDSDFLAAPGPVLKQTQIIGRFQVRLRFSARSGSCSVIFFPWFQFSVLASVQILSFYLDSFIDVQKVITIVITYLFLNRIILHIYCTCLFCNSMFFTNVLLKKLNLCKSLFSKDISGLELAGSLCTFESSH